MFDCFSVCRLLSFSLCVCMHMCVSQWHEIILCEYYVCMCECECVCECVCVHYFTTGFAARETLKSQVSYCVSPMLAEISV